MLDRGRAACAIAVSATALIVPVFGVTGASGHGGGDHGPSATGRVFQTGELLGRAGAGGATPAQPTAANPSPAQPAPPRAVPMQAAPAQAAATPPAATQAAPIHSAPVATSAPTAAAVGYAHGRSDVGANQPGPPPWADHGNAGGPPPRTDHGNAGGPPPWAANHSSANPPAAAPAANQSAAGPPAAPGNGNGNGNGQSTQSAGSPPQTTSTATAGADPAPVTASSAAPAQVASSSQDQPHHDSSSGGTSQLSVITAGASTAGAASSAPPVQTLSVTPAPAPAPAPAATPAPAAPAAPSTTLITLPSAATPSRPVTRPLVSRTGAPAPGTAGATPAVSALGGGTVGLGAALGIRAGAGTTALGGRTLPAAIASLGLTGAATRTAGTTSGRARAHRGTANNNAPAGLPPYIFPTVFQRFVNVIPGGVWLALAASLGLAAVGTGAAIGFRRKARRQAADLAAVSAAALTDPLTGVLNRRGFTEAVERELARARRYHRPFVLAYVDVRGLKQVNDTEGHLAGDALLKCVAGLLAESARADDVVGRLGGDELGLLLAESSAEAAAGITERIETQVTEKRAELGLKTPWGLTIGSAAFPEDGESFDALVGTADRRLYEQRGIELR